MNACKLAKDEVGELNSSNVLDGSRPLAAAGGARVVGLELASSESIKSQVLGAIASELSDFECILVDNVDLMKAFRTKGITG